MARWPGSAHDSNIFNNSRICSRFENGEFKDYVILGDGGYGLKPYLMTPLANPQSRGEKLYNESQIRTRNVIERTFGVMKRRFPILSLGIRLNVKTVMNIVVACAVLHNMCRFRNENLDENFLIPLEIEEASENVLNEDTYSSTRNALIRNYFSKL